MLVMDRMLGVAETPEDHLTHHRGAEVHLVVVAHLVLVGREPGAHLVVGLEALEVPVVVRLGLPVARMEVGVFPRWGLDKIPSKPGCGGR